MPIHRRVSTLLFFVTVIPITTFSTAFAHAGKAGLRERSDRAMVSFKSSTKRGEIQICGFDGKAMVGALSPWLTKVRACDSGFAEALCLEPHIA